MRELEATDGAGPRLLPLPRRCSAAGAPNGQQANGPATIPEGVYVTSTTRTDYQSRGEYSSDWSAPVYHWTMRLHDGKWVRLVRPKFRGQIGDVDGAGTYESHGDQVTFHYTYPEAGLPPETFRWSYYKGRLTFEAVDVIDRGSRIIHTAHPWRKIR
jgi:hypothetical protein